MYGELTTVLGPGFQMWVTFALIVAAFVLYASERVPMEVTSIGCIGILMLFFYFFPIPDPDGANRLAPERLLRGFANPALITLLALLVIGQGISQTGILDRGARLALDMGKGRHDLSIILVLLVVLLVSGFLNNIPVVVIFIPVMQALAVRIGESGSKVMMPLSFAAVLGGMTTLVGSSSNLLVNGALIELGEQAFGFFDFTLSGLVLAGVGFVYVAVIAPRLLPSRAPLAESLFSGAGKQFIAQISVSADSRLVGARAFGGLFKDLPDMTLRMIQRNEKAILPPFEDYTVKPGDVLVVAATRKALTEFLAQDAGLLYPDLGDGREAADQDSPWDGNEREIAEAMIAPGSRMIGQTLSKTGFRYKTHCIVLGIQRRSRMIRARLTDIRLNAGDVLLVQGDPADIAALLGRTDVILIESSKAALPALHHAKMATGILLAIVVLTASGVLPIVIPAVLGAMAMVLLGAINIGQAARALDSRIVTMIPAALAFGAALNETGGATYLAGVMIDLVNSRDPVVVLSTFFLAMAILTNIISSKAMAVLFTPIALDLALALGAPPEPFVLAVLFAANCSFASPLGYETNLMVMAPGHYTFADFVRAGLGLIFVVWGTFTLFIPWYYGM